jgi:hypothetical protein
MPGNRPLTDTRFRVFCVNSQIGPKEQQMRNTRLSLILCLALGILSAGAALAQNEAPILAPGAATQGQEGDQAKGKAQVVIWEADHSAKEALDSLQGNSHDRGDAGHGGPSAGFGGLGPSHGGGPGPHR